MPTRFYLPSTLAAEVTPANDAWDKTTGAGAARAAVRTRISSAMATVTNTKDDTTLHCSLIRQYVTEPLGAQTITGHISGAMRCIESNAAFSACVAVSVRACSQDGGTIRSPALLAISNSDLYTSTTVHEMAASLTNRLLEDVSENTSISLTSCTLSDGDRLVFEFGYRSSDTSTTRTGGISFGDNSTTDLSATDTTVTVANNPWIEFDTALVFDRSLAISGPTEASGQAESPLGELTRTSSGAVGTGSVQAVTAGQSCQAQDFSATASLGVITVFSPDVTRPSTGEQATGAVETAAANGESALTGTDLASFVGLNLAQESLSVPGFEAVPDLGSVGDVRGVALADLESLGAVDSLRLQLALPLSSPAATGTAGTVVAPGSVQEAISGEAATGLIAAPSPEASGEASSVASNVSLGDLAEEMLAAAEGIGAISDFGLIVADTGGPVERLSGVAGTSAVGGLVSSSLYWRGKFWTDTPVDGPWTETPIMQRE